MSVNGAQNIVSSKKVEKQSFGPVDLLKASKFPNSVGIVPLTWLNDNSNSPVGQKIRMLKNCFVHTKFSERKIS